EVAECRRQAVAAMLLRDPTERPKRILQSLRQRNEALPTKHNMGVLEAGECKPEVVEPMIERLAGDGDAQISHVREVGQAHPPRRMLLAEDHLLVGPVECPPRADPPLQRPSYTSPELGMAAHHLVKYGALPRQKGARIMTVASS